MRFWKRPNTAWLQPLITDVNKELISFGLSISYVYLYDAEVLDLALNERIGKIPHGEVWRWFKRVKAGDMTVKQVANGISSSAWQFR